MNVVAIGTDIVDCIRIAQMIERHGEQFICRVYTSTEIGYCSSRKSATQHFSGRWAAKEAILKVLGTGWSPNIKWRDIEIVNDATGKPSVNLSGGARDVAKSKGIADVMISISHCRTHATAYAIGLGNSNAVR